MPAACLLVVVALTALGGVGAVSALNPDALQLQVAIGPLQEVAAVYFTGPQQQMKYVPVTNDAPLAPGWASGPYAYACVPPHAFVCLK